MWHLRVSMMALVLAPLQVTSTSQVAGDCLGEYQHCQTTGECTLFTCDGPGPKCSKGQYRCPVSNHCVDSAAGLLACPGLKGTHLDHRLGTEERVTKLIAAANLTDMIGQLTNAAPPLEALGL